MRPDAYDRAGGMPSQRQLRVGELVRHALSDVFSRNRISDPELDGVIVTVAEVRMTPDLKQALVLATPLGIGDAERIIAALNRNKKFLRGAIGSALRQLKFMPDLQFVLDTRFEDDSRIDALLHKPEVARDLVVEDTADGELDPNRNS